MEKDRFFTQDKCDRCNGDLIIRTMSWFTKECICDSCSKKENEIKGKMRDKGMNPDDFEGCGFLPIDY